jgi:outer membrane biosynthesis protein TonB
LLGQFPCGSTGRFDFRRKICNVNPKYPALPKGTIGSGGWRGEFLLDARGGVVEVWAMQEVRLSPAFPAFNHAIVDAIRQWKFEPLMIGGRPAPACATVTVSINWS